MTKSNRAYGLPNLLDDQEGLSLYPYNMGGHGVAPGALASLDADIAVFVGGAAAAHAQALYLTETGDTAAISVNDLHQGQIGDCFLVAAIGELALTHSSSISNMIRTNADGTETVTLYVDRYGRLPSFGATAFKPVSVKVDNVFPSYSVNNGATQDMVGNTKEIWPQILEKAVATLGGGYGSVAYGGNPVIAMQELTGHAATYMSAARLTLPMLQSFIAAGDMITMDTGAQPGLPFNLVSHHAYMFERLSVTNGAAMVQLGNPWGSYQPSAIPFAQLAKAFVEVDIGRFA